MTALALAASTRPDARKQAVLEIKLLHCRNLGHPWGVVGLSNKWLHLTLNPYFFMRQPC
ncbi:hypothetical protein ABIB42_001617 [Massilia sp. UYP32]|uniref:hypothetical protein n=1 Tax=unclassified Massilia TaxID=2609279 RepID=UPI001C627BBD|nr:hypothetical protein [Massilia sp. NP310]QYG00176.1 hypothetical protein KY496_17510 [Massilia sp. NP310]